MTMHLEGPWLTTTNKRKRKSKRRKYSSADAARESRENRALWKQKQEEWIKMAPKFSGERRASVSFPNRLPIYSPPPGREILPIPSLNNGVDPVPAYKKADKVYTGTLIIGIATMHKSNAIPIISDEDAVAVAHMRR